MLVLAVWHPSSVLSSITRHILSVPFIVCIWSVKNSWLMKTVQIPCYRYASDSAVNRYAKIAKQLKDKTVRDVALRCRWMTVSFHFK